MVAENAIMLRYYYHTANTRGLYESIDGLADRHAGNLPNCDCWGVYDRTVPEWEVRVYCGS
jgi:hypothetical protein